jgi:3-dehydroquinate dehydratase-2
MLGVREPETYGARTLDEINAELTQIASQRNHQLNCLQSNSEAELVEQVQKSLGNTDFIVINPGALTHTSIALRDALLAVSIPFIEVHLSNVHARESFRQKSYLSDVAVGVITGLGASGYSMALNWSLDWLEANK